MKNKIYFFFFYCYMIFNVVLYLIGSVQVLKNNILYLGNLCLFFCCIAFMKDIEKNFEGIELPGWLLYVSFIIIVLFAFDMSGM